MLLLNFFNSYLPCCVMGKHSKNNRGNKTTLSTAACWNILIFDFNGRSDKHYSIPFIPEELSSWSDRGTSPFNNCSSSWESATSTGRSPRLFAWKALPPCRSSSLTICIKHKNQDWVSQSKCEGCWEMQKRETAKCKPEYFRYCPLEQLSSMF